MNSRRLLTGEGSTSLRVAEKVLGWFMSEDGGSHPQRTHPNPTHMQPKHEHHARAQAYDEGQQGVGEGPGGIGDGGAGRDSGTLFVAGD